jgi:hypothetical protein
LRADRLLAGWRLGGRPVRVREAPRALLQKY